MRIGIDCRVLSRPVSGIARFLFNWLGWLAKIDTKNRYILFTDASLLNKPELSDNFQTVIIKQDSTFMWEQYALPRALTKHKVDVFHCPQNYGIPYYKKWKVILTVFDLTPKLFPVYWKSRPKTQRIMYNIALNMSVSRADKIMAVSNYSRKDIINMFNLAEEKIEVIPGAVDTDFKSMKPFSETEIRKYGIEKEYILHIGGVGFNKNTATVLSSYRELKRNDKFDYQLVIAGDKSWFSKEILNEAEEAGGVVFTGHINGQDMPLFYTGASVFVYPSLYEGFGLPVLEAMACGTPVIVSKNSSLPEVAQDAGLYVDPYDSKELAQKTALVLKDTDLRTRLIQKGLSRAKEFSWERAAERILRLYESVMNGQ